MADSLVKRENLDTDTQTHRKYHMNMNMAIHKPRREALGQLVPSQLLEGTQAANTSISDLVSSTVGQ